jgi:MoxR-like ATPase
VQSISSAHVYHFTWQARAATRIVLGGFPADEAGGPRPTYHSARVGLVLHWAMAQVRGTSGELLERWWGLLRAMDAAYPRGPAGTAWTRHVVATACATPANVAIRDGIEQVADTLWLTLRYVLPATTAQRALVVQCPDAIPETAGYLVPLDPRLFLRAPAPAAAIPRPAPDPDADLDLAPDPDAQRAVAAADAAVRESAPGLVATADTPRIRAAMEEDGAVFLVGPAGVGKTEWAQHIARELYDGFEKVRLTSRLHEEDLYGTHMQDAAGHWMLQPGPLTRWAERVAAGKRLVLILDELPRAHGSIPDAIMAIVETHSAADLAAEDRPIPADPGPYHVVCVPGYNTFILPAARVKIVATGNLGESFRGLDLSDPAFQDRWTWWLQLADFTPDEKRAILSRHLGLPPEHSLITALIAVAKEVADYRETASRDLAASVTMRTLIRWGKAVMRRAHVAAPAGGRPAYRDHVIATAQGQWLDKVCANKGDGLDPDVHAELLGIVQRHAATL